MNSALDTLLKNHPSLWRGRDQQLQQNAIKTGFASLDRALPGGGLCPGTLTEFIVEHQGCGELSLLLPAMKRLTQQQQWAAMINTPHIPYAPAFANAGIVLERLLVVEAESDKDALWATEQLLRSGTFTMVLCWLCKTNITAQRRLQLAAETGQAIAIAYRPGQAIKSVSAAALRISLSANPIQNDKHNKGNGLSLHILKSRGGKNQSVFIPAKDFDQSQGVEWPVNAKHQS